MSSGVFYYTSIVSKLIQLVKMVNLFQGLTLFLNSDFSLLTSNNKHTVSPLQYISPNESPDGYIQIRCHTTHTRQHSFCHWK